MNVITAAFAERVAAIADHGQCLSLLHALSLGNDESAGGQVRVVAVLAVAMIDCDVVPEGPRLLVLRHPSIVHMNDAGLHRDDASPPARRDVVAVQGVAPVRDASIRPLRDDPGLARDGR